MRIMGTITAITLAAALTACGSTDDDPPTNAQNEPTTTDNDTSDDVGTRDNPHAPGDTIDLGDWTITLGPTNLDATDDVTADGMNEIEDGHTAIMVEVDATYTGPDSAIVWTDIGIIYIGGDGNSYDSSSAYCGPVENGLLQAREQFTDATVTGNVCVAIPDGADGGAWKIEPRFDRNAEDVFVAVD